VSVVDATRGGRLRSEPLVQTSGDPSLRPAWPLPWDRTDPLALARALLLGGRDGERESGGVGGVGEAFAPRCVLDSLVVAPDARRGGVGRALLAEAEALARGWGQPSLLLRVEASNSGARAFYAALGYATPAGCASEARGRRLVADSWGSKWAQALDAPLERSF
jgi:GNAT superfamily N-acetyltransferase